MRRAAQIFNQIDLPQAAKRKAENTSIDITQTCPHKYSSNPKTDMFLN